MGLLYAIEAATAHFRPINQNQISERFLTEFSLVFPICWSILLIACKPYIP